MKEYGWKPESRERRNTLLSILLKEDMGFIEILKKIKERTGEKWSTNTLSLYLDSLVENKCIVKVPRGKREIYRALKVSPEVSALLERRTIISGRIELKSLSEKELLDLWIESLKFVLLNVIQIYMVMGKGSKMLKSRGTGASITPEKLLGEYLSDLVEVCHSYGGFMADGIRVGNLDPDLVWAARNDLLEEIKRKRSTK